MTTERYGVALLKNTRDAMVIEERAKKEGLAVRIIPTPSKIYASEETVEKDIAFGPKNFGVSEEEALKTLLEEEKLSCDGFYHAEKEGLSVTYREV